MKNLLKIILIVAFCLIEISVLNFSSGSYFITLAPIIFFYFLSSSPSLSINASLIYTLFLDIASGYRVPINVLGVTVALAIYYLAHKKGIDFKYEKNRLIFCCLFCLLRIIIIYLAGIANIGFSQMLIVMIVNLVCVCLGFFVFSFAMKKISQL
jgi:hypothetical protein